MDKKEQRATALMRAFDGCEDVTSILNRLDELTPKCAYCKQPSEDNYEHNRQSACDKCQEER